MSISIKYKAAVMIALTELFLLGILLISNLHGSRENLDQQLDTQALATAELVANTATSPLLSLDLAQLQTQLDGVIGKHNVEYVSISDHNGRVLAKAGNNLAEKEAVKAHYQILVADTLFGVVDLEISRVQAETALAKTTQYNFLIVALEIALVAVISVSLGWLLTRNLTSLIDATKAIEKGDFSVRIPVDKNDEIGVLTASFNRMAERLYESMEELEEGNKRFRDIADNTSDWL